MLKVSWTTVAAGRTWARSSAALAGRRWGGGHHGGDGDLEATRAALRRQRPGDYVHTPDEVAEWLSYRENTHKSYSPHAKGTISTIVVMLVLVPGLLLAGALQGQLDSDAHGDTVRLRPKNLTYWPMKRPE